VTSCELYNILKKFEILKRAQFEQGVVSNNDEN
jgi:hypothetical protein